MEIPTSSSQSLPSPDLKDIERLVEFELRRADERRREFGWTPWALLLALAALSWQILDKSGGHLRWPQIGLVWAAALFTWELVWILGSFLHKSGPRTAAPRYVSADWALAGSREGILIDGFMQYGACVVILGWGELSQPLWMIWLFITVTFALQGPVGIALSYTDFGITTGIDESPLLRFSGTVRFFVNLTAAGISVSAAWTAALRLLDTENLKVAALLVVCSKILGWLAEHRISTPRVERLEQIRRAIGLAELTTEAAQRAVDDVLHGTRPKVLIQDHVSTFDENFKQVQSAQTNAREFLNSVGQNVATLCLWEAETALTKVKLTSAASAVKITQMEDSYQKIINRLAVAVAQDPKSTRELAGIANRLKEQLAVAKNRQTALGKDIAGAEGALAHLRK